MVRSWSPGYKGKTSQGDFTVIRQTPKGFLVQYTSGPWVDKFITMPKEIGAKTHEMEELKLSKSQKEEVLDIFYEDFPKELESQYNRLWNITDQEPSTSGLINILRSEYPPLFQTSLNKFFAKN